MPLSGKILQKGGADIVCCEHGVRQTVLKLVGRVISLTSTLLRRIPEGADAGKVLTARQKAEKLL